MVRRHGAIFGDGLMVPIHDEGLFFLCIAISIGWIDIAPPRSSSALVDVDIGI
jgi:hypothetical protein